MKATVKRGTCNEFQSATIHLDNLDEFTALRTALRYHAQYMIDSNYHLSDNPELRSFYDNCANLLEQLRTETPDPSA